MQLRKSTAIAVVLIGLGAGLAGCSGRDAYKHAFAESGTIQHNARAVDANKEQAQQAVLETFVRRGFTITQVADGTLTAQRLMLDDDDDDISYRITTTAAIASVGDRSLVTLSANQRTQRNASRGYVILKESTISEPEFFDPFFAEVDQTAAKIKALEAYARPAAPAAVPTSASPASSATTTPGGITSTVTAPAPGVSPAAASTLPQAGLAPLDGLAAAAAAGADPTGGPAAAGLATLATAGAAAAKSTQDAAATLTDETAERNDSETSELAGVAQQAAGSAVVKKAAASLPLPAVLDDEEEEAASSP